MSGGHLTQAKGPKNNQPSAWSIRQLRHLVAAFHEAGATLRIPDAIALTGEDGRTWRPDKAPQDVKDVVGARVRREHEEAVGWCLSLKFEAERSNLAFPFRFLARFLSLAYA